MPILLKLLNLPKNQTRDISGYPGQNDEKYEKEFKDFFDKLLFNTKKIIKFYMDNIKNFNLQFDENNIDDLINIFSYLDDFVSAISESNSNTNESYEKIRLNKNNTFLNTFKHI